jgi:hypothetical protein
VSIFGRTGRRPDVEAELSRTAGPNARAPDPPEQLARVLGEAFDPVAIAAGHHRAEAAAAALRDRVTADMPAVAAPPADPVGGVAPTSPDAHARGLARDARDTATRLVHRAEAWVAAAVAAAVAEEQRRALRIVEHMVYNPDVFTPAQLDALRLQQSDLVRRLKNPAEGHVRHVRLPDT